MNEHTHKWINSLSRRIRRISQLKKRTTLTLKCHRLSALQASQMNRHLRSSGSPGRQKERPNCRTCRSLQPSGTRLRTHWHHGDTSISNSTTVWQIRSIEHEFSFDLALTRLSRKDRRRASNAWKCWQSFQGISDPFASQAGRSDWKDGETWQDAGLPEGAARDSLQFMVIIELSFSSKGFAGHNRWYRCTILEPRSVASSVFETHQLQLKAKAMISQLALAA